MIYVGTCGYSYKDWIGPFYPGTIRQPEMLAYYARQFSAVEIDSSYYGALPVQTVERMNARTPPGFRFCFKAPSSLTHQRATGDGGVPAESAPFSQSLAPILNAGKLGSVLLQFPNSFQPNDATREYVKKLVTALHPIRCVAEFRHRSWQSAQTMELLADLGAGYCNVDMPSYETLMRPSSEVTSGIGYVRFHGRNAQNWWKGTNVTRYDYSYSPEELLPWTERIAEIDAQAETTFAFFNNHARGNAARNAEMFADLLRERYGAAGSVGPGGQGPSQTNLFG